jgi:hypothetical protein
MMSTRQPDGQAGDGAVPSTDRADQGVREAEGSVTHAWEELLLKRRTHMESALSAAIECCDTAYLHPAAAQRKGDPTTISTAHAILEKALELARRSSIACDRIQRAGYAELTWLGWEIDDYVSTVDAVGLEQRGPVTSGRGHAAWKPPHQASQVSVVKRPFCHGRRWLAQALLRDKPLTPRPATPNHQHV